MIVQKISHPRDPEHVIITPNTSLQLYFEMDLRLRTHTQPLDMSDTHSNTDRLLRRRQKAIVICGFAAIGKSTFKAAFEDGYAGFPVVDLDSSFFPKGPSWPHNYLEAINERLADRCILMISTHQIIYSRLLEDGVDLILVYPKRELKAEWLERIRQREAKGGIDSSSSIRGIVNKCWDGWISEYDQQTRCPKYEILEGEYLQGSVDEVVHIFEQGLLISRREQDGFGEVEE